VHTVHSYERQPPAWSVGGFPGLEAYEMLRIALRAERAGPLLEIWAIPRR
jgi:hypothetical protein